jgi:hypothetical protein
MSRQFSFSLLRIWFLRCPCSIVGWVDSAPMAHPDIDVHKKRKVHQVRYNELHLVGCALSAQLAQQLAVERLAVLLGLHCSGPCPLALFFFSRFVCLFEALWSVCMWPVV